MTTGRSATDFKTHRTPARAGELVERRNAHGITPVLVGHQVGMHDTPVRTDRNERYFAVPEQLGNMRARDIQNIRCLPGREHGTGRNQRYRLS